MIFTFEYSPGCKGDFFLPESKAAADGYPAILLIHGGAWSSMDRSAVSGIAEMLCRNGYAVFNIDYHLAPEYTWPCGIDDCILALKYLIEKIVPAFELDSKHIFVMGASSGGHYALITGLRAPSKSIAGIISISGINDVFSDFRLHPERYICLLGHIPTTEELKKLDPAEYYYKGAPPIFCTHFIRDNVVAADCSLRLTRKIKEKSGTAELYIYDFNRDGEGHAIWRSETIPKQLYPDLEQEILFFLRNLI